MATTFLEPGGDADFAVTSGNGFWGSIQGTPAVATDFVHGSHIKSISYPTAGFHYVHTSTGVMADTGSRLSLYIYLNALGNSTTNFVTLDDSGGSGVVWIRITSGGVLQLASSSAQIGSNGATLATGKWYRISLAYTITDTTHNRFELFVDSVPSISVTNGTLGSTGTSKWTIGNISSNATFDLRTSDHYVDNSAALTDTGNIWVTAKRPNANGTANNFGTQIGSGGSGYGSGHSPQVNERALSTTNGWSVVAVGATTEEYNIESKATGDIDLSTAIITDYTGWVSAKSLTSETASIVVNGSSSNISLTSTITLFTKIAGSATYPVGTGTDIGIVTDATATTVSLYECGIIVAFIPNSLYAPRHMRMGI